MAFFWHGHFCSEWGKVFDTGAMMQQNKLFRDGGLGNVRTLAQAMAIQPAMLRYLDNADNRKNSPNQNFGRELLELFLLGVGNYTEADVEAATSAWTGHGLNSSNQYVFTASQHDSTVRDVPRSAGLDGPDVIDVVLGPDGDDHGRPQRGHAVEGRGGPVPQQEAVGGVRLPGARRRRSSTLSATCSWPTTSRSRHGCVRC